MPIRVNRTIDRADSATDEYASGGGGAIVVPRPIVPAAGGFPGASQAAATLAAKLYQEDRDAEIETKVNEADANRMRADRLALGEFQQLTGKAAVDGREKAMAAIQANHDAAVKALEQDATAADAYARINNGRTAHALDQVDSHYRTESRRYQEDTLKDRQALLQDQFTRTALGSEYNPETGELGPEAARLRSAWQDDLQKLGALTGAPPEAVELAKRKADAEAYAGVANQLLDDERFDEAGKLLERHRAELGPDQAGRVESVVRRGRVRQEGLDLSTEILQKARQAQQRTAQAAVGAAAPADSRWVDVQEPMRVDPGRRPDYGRLLGDALADLDSRAASGKVSAELYDQVRTRIEHAVDVEHVRQAREDNQLFDRVETILESQKDQGYADLPATLQKQVEDAGGGAKMRRFAESRRWVTTPHGMDELLRYEQQPQLLQGQRLDVILRDLHGELGEEHQNQLRHLWDLSNTRAPGQGLPADVVGSMIRLAAVDAGILKKGTTGNTPEDLTRFERWELDIRMRLEALGGKPDQKAVQQAIADANLDRERDPSGVDVPRSTLSETEQQAGSFELQGLINPGARGTRVDFSRLDMQSQARALQAIADINLARADANEKASPRDRRPLLPLTPGSIAEVLGDEAYRRQTAAAQFESLVRRFQATLLPPFPDIQPTTDEERKALEEAEKRVRAMTGSVPSREYFPRSPWGR